MYQPQRSDPHQNPKHHPLQHRTHPHLPHRSPRNPRPNQIKRRSQSQFPHHAQNMPCPRTARYICICNRSQTKKRYKPRPLYSAVRPLHYRCPHRHRHNPQRPRQFHSGPHHQSDCPIARGRPHHRTRVMNRQRCPQSELLLRQMQQPPQRRKNQQRNRVQNKNRSQRYRRLLLIRVNNRRHSRNRAAAANRRPHRDQNRCSLVHPQHSPSQQSRGQRERNARRRVHEPAAPRAQHFVQVHSKSQPHHRCLQQIFRRGARLRLPRMRKSQSEY